jgi:hypothetical protein
LLLSFLYINPEVRIIGIDASTITSEGT